MYTMDDVMRVLTSNDVNRHATAATMYWYATERALNFETCVKHVEILALNKKTPVTTDFMPFRKALINGEKINAIKELRSATGWGLREAKDAVESFLGGHNRIVMTETSRE